jgi:16S rRNA (cytidine1402-2'-O)-methyltransferase
MSLELVATPIGDAGDLTLRAIEVLKAADVVIGEERKEVSKLLRSLGLEGKRMELLNEHTRDNELTDLVALCRSSRVALVTDCGTPGFCDPGARLVALCRAEGLSSRPVPGASSLMCLLSVSGSDMRSFLFRGFLPAEREERAAALSELTKEKRPVVLMDTPYRLGRLLSELAERLPARRVLLGMDFTQASETVIEALARDLPKLVGDRKAEFILALYPAPQPQGSATASPNDRRDRRSGSGSRGGPGDGRKFTPGRRR